MAIYRMINGTLQKVAGATSSLLFSVAIPTTNWTADGNGGAYVDVQVLGISANDNPIVSLEITNTDTASTAKDKRVAFSCIDRIDTYDNYIRVFCLDINQLPTTGFTILIRK